MKGLLLLLCCLLAANAVVAQYKHRCETLTGIVGCIECKKNVCLYCARNRAMQWTTTNPPAIRSCSVTTTTTCDDTKFGAACRRCTTGTLGVCIQCTNPSNFYLSWANNANFGKCISGTPAVISGNNACTQFNADRTCGTCSAVNGVRRLAVPNNARFTNGVFPQSTCMTWDAIATMANTAFGAAFTSTWRALYPKSLLCAEVGTDLKCQRCVAGYSLAVPTGAGRPWRCIKDDPAPAKNKNGCVKGLAWQQYCLRCNAAGTACTQCAPGRGMKRRSGNTTFDGQCSLPCKQLFGITCGACTQNFGAADPVCTANDGAFPQGRR